MTGFNNVSVFIMVSLWEAHDAKRTRVWCCIRGLSRILGLRGVFISEFRKKGSQVQWPHLLAAQSFPRDTTEEGMALNVTHTSTSRTQAIAGIELKQL